MDIAEAKKCLKDKTPVRISGSYLFDNKSTRITNLVGHSSIDSATVEGSVKFYELSRIYKYIDLTDPEIDFENEGAYAD
jgi:hypothetical protein